MSADDFDALLTELSRAIGEDTPLLSSAAPHLHQTTRKNTTVSPPKQLYDREGHTFHTLLPRLDEDVVTGRYIFSVKFTRLQSNPFQRLCFETGKPVALYKSKKRKDPVMVVCVDTVKLNTLGRTAHVNAWVVTGNDMQMHGG
mgnify:CR=1 FL=1